MPKTTTPQNAAEPGEQAAHRIELVERMVGPSGQQIAERAQQTAEQDSDDDERLWHHRHGSDLLARR